MDINNQALKKDIRELVEKHYGSLGGKRDDEISQIFWTMYFNLTRVMSRDIIQEITPPKIVKLEFIDENTPPNDTSI